MRRIESGEEAPPKPDFISQEQWDGLIVFRSDKAGIRAVGSQHAQAYIDRVEGSGEMAGAPVIVLTTIGRKSGNEIPTALNYIRENDSWFVCGSFFGLPEDPHWAKNLKMEPRAWVQDGDQKHPVDPSLLAGDERADIWHKMIEHFPLWGYFQQYCRREFPIYRLTPK